jgi:hypothetical protein
MNIQDAQREVRSVYIGGFVRQLVSSAIWLVSAALGTWVSPKASILTVVIGGFLIFALTQKLLRLSGRRASVSRDNLFNRHVSWLWGKLGSELADSEIGLVTKNV